MNIVKFEELENRLIQKNNELVLLDKDVAELYGIEQKKLKKQLKRNNKKLQKEHKNR